MKRTARLAMVAGAAEALLLALGCGDLRIGAYADAGAGGGAGSASPLAGSAGASSGGTKGEAGAITEGGMLAIAGGSGKDGTGEGATAGDASSSASGSSMGGVGGAEPGGAPGSGGEGGQDDDVVKPKAVQQWEPHQGAAVPRLTALGYVMPTTGLPVGTVYVGYDNGEVFLGSSAPSHWVRVDSWYHNMGAPEDYQLPRLPVSTLRLSSFDVKSVQVGYSGGQAIKLWHSFTGGQSWSPSDAGPMIDVLSISIDPGSHGSNRLAVGFVGGYGYVYNSANSGASWSPGSVATPGFPSTQGQVSTICSDGDEAKFWAGSSLGEVFVGEGPLEQRVWKQVASPEMPQRTVASIALDPHDAQRAYVTFVGRVTEGLWVTEDGGATFDPVAGQGLPAEADDFIFGVSVHPTFEGVLYLATSRGPFWSSDGGAKWHP